MVPNYNSNAIESCIHRIPGLSEYFIYMNDDFFIMKKLSIGDLIEDSTERCSVFMETDPIINVYNKYLSSYMSMIIHLIGGTARARRYTYKCIGLDRTSNIPIGHCCRIYNKDLILEFESEFSSQIDNTRHQRFRTTNSFCFCDAYAFHYGRLKKVNLKYNRKTKLILFTDHAIINDLQIRYFLINPSQYHFLAILDVRTKVNKDHTRRMQQFLDHLFPVKGDLEADIGL
jgi:hypothetical protein